MTLTPRNPIPNTRNRVARCDRNGDGDRDTDRDRDYDRDRDRDRDFRHNVTASATGATERPGGYLIARSGRTEMVAQESRADPREKFLLLGQESAGTEMRARSDPDQRPG